MDPTNVNISRQVFNPKFLPLLDNDDAINIFYGSASSGKSHFIAQRYIMRILKNPLHNILATRKVGETSRDSTYAELAKVIYSWNLERFFKLTVSPLHISRRGGGDILFRGLDDVLKLKSITLKRGILNDIWAEEATEMTKDDILDLQLRQRGKSDIPIQLTMSFNPISALHWIKKMYIDIKQTDCIVHHSTYLDNNFLGEREKITLEKLKILDSVKYDIYALGKWGILGNLIYSNYIVHEFEDDFDRHYNGQDWGFNHPTVGLKMGFRDDEIYIIDMFYQSQSNDPELMRLAKRIWDKQREHIIADSANPLRISDWKKAGWMMEAARKGQDSVRNGIGWIRSHKLHIHPRCQAFINEIQGYAYRKDKDGNVIDEPVKFRDDAMDAMRYGLEQLMDLKEYRILAV